MNSVLKTSVLSLGLLLSAVLPEALAFKPGGAQNTPKFETTKIKVANKTITVELADNDERRSFGLMFREKLAEDQGMLFIFPYEQRLTFWMKDTLIPLSIGYYDKNKKLIDIQEMVPAVLGAQSPRLYPSKEDAMYALEMSKGWFAKNNVKLGSTFSFISKP